MSKKPIGKLPDGWKWVQLGEVCKVVNQRKPVNSEPPVMSISKYDGFVPSLEYFSKQVFSKDVSGYKYIRSGQFAYSTIHLDEGSVARFIGEEGCLISPMYTTFEINEKVDGRFLLSLLKSQDMVSYYHTEAQGSVNRRKSIPFSVFERMYIPLPPLPVQNWIADALESIDEWLEESRRSSEWLEIARRKIIAGVFPPGKIELAELIESITAGVSAEGASTPASANESGVVKVSAVVQGFFNPSENKLVIGKEVSRLRTPVKAGDILVSRSNTLELVGEVGMSPKDYPNLFLPDKLWALRVKSSLDIDQKWLMYYLVSIKNSGIIAGLASGSSGSMKNISQKQYLKILVPKIDIESQREVSSALTVLDECIIAQNEYLAVGKRFRQSFFHQILSGKLQPKVGWEAVLRQSAQAGAP